MPLNLLNKGWSTFISAPLLPPINKQYCYDPHRDTGIGMSGEQLMRLFQPFIQGAITRSPAVMVAQGFRVW